MKNLEKYLIDFDTLKVGDKVWSIEEGEVEVTELFEKFVDQKYPLLYPFLKENL